MRWESRKYNGKRKGRGCRSRIEKFEEVVRTESTVAKALQEKIPGGSGKTTYAGGSHWGVRKRRGLPRVPKTCKGRLPKMRGNKEGEIEVPEEGTPVQSARGPKDGPTFFPKTCAFPSAREDKKRPYNPWLRALKKTESAWGKKRRSLPAEMRRALEREHRSCRREAWVKVEPEAINEGGRGQKDITSPKLLGGKKKKTILESEEGAWGIASVFLGVLDRKTNQNMDKKVYSLTEGGRTRTAESNPRGHPQAGCKERKLKRLL